MEKLEKLIANERRERARANELWYEYLRETNTRKATTLLKERDAAMQLVHALVRDQGVLTLGKNEYNRITNRREAKQPNRERNIFFGYSFA